jgi:uncharacterized metal-binding protein YceD (DUF177 family)
MTVAVPEFHRPLAVDRIGPAGLEHSVTATPAECAALTPRLGIPAVLSLECRFRLRRAEGGRIAADGNLRARLVRDCVISLDPFEMDVAEDFQVAFVPEGQESDDLDPESEDEIPYAGGAIDLGEAAAEQLALSLDPYPHKPGVALPEAASEPLESPFASLSRRQREN